MAASHADLRSRVTDALTCPICLELFNSPKSLPCLHTFCLKCIEGHCRANEPGDEVACPVCRQKFNIPEKGISGLISNFFIAGLVEARKNASDVAVQVCCEVCSSECDPNDDNAAMSTMYCVDCSQKLCERCSLPHRKMKGAPHKVVPIGSEIEAELIQTLGGKCDKHDDEYVKLYCFDDMMNICMMCFAEEHQQHKCKNINAVAAECVKQIDADLANILNRSEGARDEISRLDEERQNILVSVEDVGNKIKATGEELKQLIDAQVNELLLEVQSLKTETCKKIEGLIDSVEMKLLAFETFSAYCSELKLKGKPCDITRAANNLHARATELLQTDVALEGSIPPTIITFTTMNVQDLLDAGQNLIGRAKLDTVTDPTVISSSISFVTSRVKTLEEQLAANKVESDTKINTLQAQSNQQRYIECDLKTRLQNLEVQANALQQQRRWRKPRGRANWDET